MSAAQFAAEDRRIKEANLAAVATAAAASGVKTGAEQAEETVYRDKKGRKLDMLNEFMRQQAIREGNLALRDLYLPLEARWNRFGLGRLSHRPSRSSSPRGLTPKA